MDKYTVYVGMDVHARSITAQALNKKTGEIAKKRFGASHTPSDIADWALSLGDKAYIAYESGCTGVWLARELRALGVDCDVIAISTMARSTKDKQGKCDKLDAKAILREMINPLSSYSCVYIPTEAEEGLRDLCRAYASIRDDVKRKKQELSGFLMRHGHVWNERTRTGRAKRPKGRDYEKWLNSISFDDADTQSAFCTYRRRKDMAEKELMDVKRELKERSEKPDVAPYVEALTQVKGIDTLSALIVKAEFCDFKRFSSGRKVSSWLGTVPLNSSSGEKMVHGGITKAGDRYLRRTLIEAVCSIGSWSSSASKGSEGRDPAISSMARTANRRLKERYAHLTHDLGKHTNKAKVAVVNELVRWCWVIGLEVQRGI